MTITLAPVIAWHGDPDLKAKTVAALRLDHEQDRLVRGIYASSDPSRVYRGCMVGCLVANQIVVEQGINLDRNSFNLFAGMWHAETASRFGVPESLAHLWDSTFEGLPYAESPQFAIDSIEAMTPGADLSLVPSLLVADILGHPERGVLANPDLAVEKRDATAEVLALFARRLAADEPTETEWEQASMTAYDVQANPAYYASGEYETYADSTAGMWADDERDWLWIAERLIHHTRTAPVPVAA